jgi:type II secretory pathway component HofQ
LLVADGKTAEIKIIEEIPVQQLTQTDAGGSIGTTTFREAGITLDFEPTVCPDGTVLLKVISEISALVGTEAGRPIIDRRTMTSMLRMTSGETSVTLGLEQVARSLTGRKLDAAKPTETETVILITAEIFPSRAQTRQTLKKTPVSR